MCCVVGLGMVVATNGASFAARNCQGCGADEDIAEHGMNWEI